ncbi:hypothetical protein [Flavobacterium sp.]|uniref:hypothetical protein n=1 Tax=Flavobacterium sp. TaxID=239 RepID=UPI00261B7417|nr:hypothetical protein [Flavobacterium sp.]
MKKIIFLLFFSLSNLIYSQVDEKILLDNFITSVNTWNGEEHIYVLINFKDLNTNLIKEICIIKSELRNALACEYSISKNEAYTKLENYKSQNFEFKNIDAITILNRYYYSENQFNEFKKNVNIDKIVNDIETKKNWFLDLDDLNSKENLYASLLSKKGYIINITFQCFGQSGLWCLSCLENK